MSVVRVPALLLVLALAACGGRSDSHGAATPPPAPVVVPSPAADVAVEPVASRTLQRAEVPGRPDYLAAGRDAVWSKTESGALVQFDPRTAAVVRTVQATQGLCQGLGVRGDDVWTCDGNNVVRLDARTGRLDPVVNVAKHRSQTRIGITADRIWVLLTDGTRLASVDPRTRAVTMTVELGAPCIDLDVTDSRIWVICPSTGELLRVTPEGSVAGRTGGLPEATSVVATSGAVWVGYRDGLAKVGPDGRVLGAVAVVPGREAGLSADATGVWVRSGDRFLRRVDAATLQLTDEVSAEEGGGSVLLAFGAVWASIYDKDLVYRLRP
jgi:glutamine cyclotransferase